MDSALYTFTNIRLINLQNKWTQYKFLPYSQTGHELAIVLKFWPISASGVLIQKERMTFWCRYVRGPQSIFSIGDWGGGGEVNSRRLPSAWAREG